jgi:hypothetical protein
VWTGKECTLPTACDDAVKGHVNGFVMQNQKPGMQVGAFPYLFGGGITNKQASLQACSTQCMEAPGCKYGTFVLSNAKLEAGYHAYGKEVKFGECWLSKFRHQSGKETSCSVTGGGELVHCQGFAKREITSAPTKGPTRTPTRNPTGAPTKSTAPTKAPTTTPTKAPTLAPTPHPCDDGSHSCDKVSAGGICYADRTSNLYACGCREGFMCIGGCDEPFIGHLCELTKAPTKTPTKEPTKEPTKAPTKEPTKEPTHSPTVAPTVAPTFHPCDDGSHGCHKGEGGVCNKEAGYEYSCGCAAGYQCKAGCDQPYVGHTCWETKAPTSAPTSTPTTSPTPMPTHVPTSTPTPAVHPCTANNYVVRGFTALDPLEPAKCIWDGAAFVLDHYGCREPITFPAGGQSFMQAFARRCWGVGGRKQHDLLVPLHKAELECGVLRRIANGEVLTSTRDPMQVEYTCDDGFELHGPSERKCKEDDWSWGWVPEAHGTGGVSSCRISIPSKAPTASPTSTAPTDAPSVHNAIPTSAPVAIEIHTLTSMAAECDTPTAPAHGFLDSWEGNLPGDKIHVRCNFGYRALVPAEGVTRTCLAGGKWSGAIPLCTASTASPTRAPTVNTVCPIATPPPHATMVLTGPTDTEGERTVGTKARFTCPNPSTPIMQGPAEAECVIAVDVDVDQSAKEALPRWTPFPKCADKPTLCSHMRCNLATDSKGVQHISVLHHRREVNGNQHRCTAEHSPSVYGTACSCMCWTVYSAD